MKTINNFITEKLRIGKSIKTYNYFPKDKFELRKILEERLAEDKNANLNDIDVSQITDMCNIPLRINWTGLFQGLDPHDIDISSWDVSNVTRMLYMFYGCENFNCDLSKWDVSNVTNMSYMFRKCENFTGKGLENWNVSKLIHMKYMFDGCTSLKNKPSWYK